MLLRAFEKFIEGDRRPLTSYSKVQRAVSTVIRNRRLLVPSLAGRRLLNAGCGDNVRPEFINLDYQWHPGIDLCWDLRRPLPLRGESLDGVYSEHCLEHLTHDDALAALREFWRVLVPGGRVRIVVPDAELFMDLYIRRRHGETVTFPYVDAPRPNWTPMVTINRIFRDHGHQYAWDAETLALALERAGFKSPVRQSFMTGSDARLLIDSEVRAVESLYIEATR